jgi:hypothetical protein
MVDFIINHNGHISNGQEVIHINVPQKQVWLKEGDCYTYDQMIWAADLNTLYNCLDAQQWPSSPLREKVLKKQRFLSTKKGADSVLSIYIIVDQTPEVFQSISGPHAFYTSSPQGLSRVALSDLMDENGCFTNEADTIFHWFEAFVKQNTLEISIPALRDPSLSPPGETALIVSLLFDYQLTKTLEIWGYMSDLKRHSQN